MKKTSKLFGAVALSAALAMGCAVPALASTADGTDVGTTMSTPKEPGDTGEGHEGMHTDVSVKTKIGQISVSVPLTVTIVAPTEGGAVAAPSAGLKDVAAGTATIKGYRIENTSSFPVEISKVATKAAGSEWAITGTTYNKGLLTMTLTPSDTAKANLGLTDDVTAINEGDRTGKKTPVAIDGTEQEAGWKIAGGGTATNPRIMGLILAGTSSAIKNVGAVADADNSLTAAEDAFTVSYTVAATTLTDAEQIK